MIELQHHNRSYRGNFEILLCSKDKEQNLILSNFIKTLLLPQNLINEN